MCPAAAVPAGSALPPWDQPAELDRRPPYQTILAWELTLIGIGCPAISQLTPPHSQSQRDVRAWPPMGLWSCSGAASKG